MISPDIPVTVFENVPETLKDSKVMHSAEVWELEERWKEKETVHCKYSFKKSGKDIHGCGQPSTQNEIKKTQ